MRSYKPYLECDNEWATYPDYHRETKISKNYIVEFIGGTERGAIINLFPIVPSHRDAEGYSTVQDLNYDRLLDLFKTKNAETLLCYVR